MRIHRPDRGALAALHLRKAERRARNETARGIYDHLFHKGAAYQWPNVLNTIRDWAEEQGLEDPK